MDKPENQLSRKDAAALAQWLANQRGRPQYRHAPSAAMSVNKILRPLAKKFGAGITPIHQNWDHIMGKRFAKISSPVKMMGGRDGRTLVIKAPGAAAALIMASSGQILDRLNTFLGHGHVARIKVIQSAMDTATPHAPTAAPSARGLTPREDAALQSGLSGVSDPALRQALEALGRKALGEAPPKTNRDAAKTNNKD